MTFRYLRLTPFAAVALFGLVACKSEAPVATGPSPREIALAEEVEQLKGKLSTAEQALETARIEAERKIDQLALELAKLKKAAETTATATTAPVKDTSYIVVKKTFTAGRLVPAPTPGNPNASERVPAVHQITFKGAQSGREYPALDIQENAFGGFREGVAYAGIDLVRAKKPVAGATTSAKGSAGTAAAGSGTLLSADEARAIFGD